MEARRPEGSALVDELYMLTDALQYDLLQQTLGWITTTTDWKTLALAMPKSRKVIHYGMTCYNTGGVSGQADEMPPVIAALREVLVNACRHIEGVTHRDMDFVQCIVNKYEKGQGIGAHIDSMDFGPVIGCFVFNLDDNGAESAMTFTLNGSDTLVATPHNSLYIMTGLARYNYRHALVGRKAYATRVSITFRSIAAKQRDLTTHKVIGYRE
jgi:alkylated DNA repair dioxygenase AlkB